MQGPREFLKVGYEKQKISLRPCRGIRPEDTTKIWGMNKKIYVQDPDREQLIALESILGKFLKSGN